MPVDDPGKLVLSGDLPVRSIKGAFLPPTEVLFAWKQEKGNLRLEPVPHQFPPTVVLGARPCDAAAAEIVDKLMGWDYRDEPWFGRREATTIVALACEGFDESCFCTAVGLGPDATRGADLLLTPLKGGYHVNVLSPKGQSLVDKHAKHFGEGPEDSAAKAFWDEARAKIDKNLKPVPGDVGSWLEGHFDDSFWEDIALRCHGCGACASVCPTCHCFDIVDEPRSVSAGVRRRNWDTCQTAKFTLHGSGHNPRRDQNARIRQRVTHKFSVYPKRFGETLCTGCGRCARACPGGMDLAEILAALTERIGGAA
jgi:ferredoxin